MANTKNPQVTVLKDPEVPTEILAQAIVDVAQAAKKLLNGPVHRLPVVEEGVAQAAQVDVQSPGRPERPPGGPAGAKGALGAVAELVTGSDANWFEVLQTRLDKETFLDVVEARLMVEAP